MGRRTVMDILRDMRTPHDPATGEVLTTEQLQRRLQEQGVAVTPPRPQTAAQKAVADGTRMRGRTRGATEEGEGPAPIVATNLQAALRGMQDHAFLKTQKHQEQHWRAKREGAHPDILEFEKRMRRRMAKLGVPVFAHCVVRSLEQQAIEFAQGDSKVRFGAHNVGCAIDLVHGTKAWGLTDRQWDLVGHVGKEVISQAGLALVNFRWGGPDGPGDKFDWDPAHWEIDGWKMLQDKFPWPEALR